MSSALALDLQFARSATRNGYSLALNGAEVATVEIRGDGWHGTSTGRPYTAVDFDLGVVLGDLAWMAGACKREDAKRIGSELASRWATGAT